ncbi:hypothetical protein QBC34DRAFT_458635 [Podospora aff. communis PSN243]|uniref:DUF7907 domain-containing protein n=1 Tax=Podospora aff. communis PSN243 TaxID=3040156 RepID=A0AAV9GUV5_9PEZI|nr:hypothetical protein QBC34DRAFT_458635 [Podospora aff. communis PSN243]
MLTTLLLTAALAAASPLSPRQKTPLDYPPRFTGDAFTLIANVTSSPPNPLFNPHHWVLSTEQVGSGKYAAVLSPTGPGTVLFLNGTARDISAENTSILAPPANLSTGVLPVGMQFNTAGQRRVAVELNYGMGQVGAGIGIGLRDPYPRLFPPVSMQFGTFMVCKEPNPAPGAGRPEYPVYWARSGVVVVAENCVGISLLAQCAPLPELAGVEKWNIIKAQVGCYEDVKAIDWSQW